MEEYAEKNRVPTIKKDALEFILKIIKKERVKNILEIGSAIGYSAIRMALEDEKIKITTIERDAERYQECLSNIEKFGLDGRITVINQDAFDFNVSENQKYDFIFIDAAKAQNI